MRGGKKKCIAATVVGVIAWSLVPALGQSLNVKNPSFENPTVPPPPVPAVPGATDWTTVGNGPVFDPNSPPNANAGVFANRPGEGYITNGDDQGAFMSAFTGNEFSQLLSDTYVPGKTYSLTVGIARSHFAPPTPGDKLTLQFYYLDSLNARHTVTSTDVTYGTSSLSDTLYTDYSVPSVTIAPGDPAANQQIGVAMVATGSGFGFFDMDNVRAAPEPSSLIGLGMLGLVSLSRRRRA